jgi:hypothetical protein
MTRQCWNCHTEASSVEENYCRRCGSAFQPLSPIPQNPRRLAHPRQIEISFPDPREIGNPEIGRLYANMPGLFTTAGCLFILGLLSLCGFAFLIISLFIRYPPP